MSLTVTIDDNPFVGQTLQNGKYWIMEYERYRAMLFAVAELQAALAAKQKYREFVTENPDLHNAFAQLNKAKEKF